MPNPSPLGPGFKVHLDLFAALRGFAQGRIAAHCQWFSSLSHQLIPNPVKVWGWTQSRCRELRSWWWFSCRKQSASREWWIAAHWICNHLQQEPLLATCWNLWTSYHEGCLIQSNSYSPWKQPILLLYSHVSLSLSFSTDVLRTHFDKYLVTLLLRFLLTMTDPCCLDTKVYKKR